MAEIVFKGVSATVVDQRSKDEKTILHGITGAARPGRLMAIMGASGAGKSTLLDVLAGNSRSSAGLSIKGMIQVDGKPRSKKEFARRSCYVQQRDVLLASATVREAITTSAQLKLPYAMSTTDKEARVNQVIRELDLEGCADTLIGDETLGMKGISGGQKRRVSVGIELVKDPAIVFLDEPTSGLDSEMALGCVETLLRLARKGRTVVCTIHQPNSDITALFDDLMLLAAGHVVYAGPWAGAVDHFAACGYVCPAYKNPTDYFMSVLKEPQAAERLWTAWQAASERQQPYATSTTTDRTASLATTHMAHAGTPDVEKGLEAAGPSLDAVQAPAPATQAATPWWFQTGVLVRRKLLDWVRNPNMLGSELLQYVVIGLFVGLMYFDSFTSDVSDGVTNRTACIWFAFAVMSFTPSFTTVTVWDKERQLLKREVNQKMYGVNTHYLARTLVMVPFQALQCLLFVAIMYFFAGFQADAGKFFTFFVALLLFQLISEGVGLLAAIITNTATYAVVLLTFMMLLILSFSGFLVTKIPVYFRWLNKASYLTYAFAGLTINEFEGLTFTDSDGSPVPGLDAVPASILNGFSAWGNIGILAAWAAGMELVKLGALQVAYRARLL